MWHLRLIGLSVNLLSSHVFSLLILPPSPVASFIGTNAPITFSKSVIKRYNEDHSLHAAPSSSHYTFNKKDKDKDATSTFDFVAMKRLDNRLEDLERTAPDTLGSYFEGHLQSFSVRPGGQAQRFSVTSSVLALETMTSAVDCSIYESMKKSKNISMPNIVQAALTSEWREDDLFQVPLLLFTVLTIGVADGNIFSSSSNAEQNAVKKLITSVLAARPQRRQGSNQQYSDYITYQCTRAMAALDQLGLDNLPPSALSDENNNAAYELSLGLERAVESSRDELCRQLAYRTSGDRTSFDPVRLAYSLLTYLTASEALAGTAGRELVEGEGSAAGTVVLQPNRYLVLAALDVYFEEQGPDGMWAAGQPIYKSFRRSGKNVGNAFVFAVDTVASLLHALPAEDFRPHLGALSKTLSWIERHQLSDVIPDYCDPTSGQCYGKTLRGWSSPHLTPDVGPQAWSTAQTLTCVSRLRKVVREILHNDVLNEFGGRFLSKDGPKTAAWDRLLDTDLGSSGLTLKKVLEERMIIPFEKSTRSNNAATTTTTTRDGGKCNPSIGAAYSSILFGPPGTAKTTICESLAERMGWDFVVIDTSSFLADGLTNIAGRINYVFDRLQALENTIILFDEIEEFCLDRETPGLGMESRMLTTAMLTAINDLRRAKRSIFFLATNRLRAFDSAIIRPGRFDMQLFVGTPNLSARCILFRDRLSRLTLLPDETKADAEKSFRSFLETVWTEDIIFFNYLESVQFASACADLLAAGNELSDEAMAAILNSQAKVMTVRGQVREEYLASMELSRL